VRLSATEVTTRVSGPSRSTAWPGSETRQRKRPGSTPLWGASAAIVICVAALNALGPGNGTLTQRVLASTITAIAGVVIAGWWRRASWANPFLGLFASIYAIYYALPVFLLANYSRAYYLADTIPDRDVEAALWLAAGGLLTCLTGYGILRASPLAARLPRLRLAWKQGSAVKGVGVVFALAGVAAYYVVAFQPIPLWAQQIAHYLADLALVGILMLWAAQLQGWLGPLGRCALWAGLVPLRVGLGFGTGFIAEALEVALMLAMTYSFLRGRVPWRSLAAGFVALLLLLPIRAEFRQLTWWGDAAALSPVRKAMLYPLVVGEYLGTLDAEQALQVSVSRLSHLMTFAEVVAETPGEVPYAFGGTYYSLLFTLVPRVLYPDKPTAETAQWFGHRYGFLDPADTTTSYNLPQLIELYVNFGSWGVLLGMLVIGALYSALVRVFARNTVGLGGGVAGAYVLGKLLLMESGTALVLGGLVWSLVFVACVHGAVRLVERRG